MSLNKERIMKTRALQILITLTVVVAVTGCGPGGNRTLVEKQQVVKDMEKETLERLYKEAPEAKEKIEKAAGYGTFSNANVNLILVSAGGGYGSVVDNSTGERTYMKMALGGVGLGLGAKDYRQVLIFKSERVLRKFIDSGWEFGAHADAAAKAGESGGEASGEGVLGADIEAYSMTETGLALQATVAGTKYWKDKNLNQ